MKSMHQAMLLIGIHLMTSAPTQARPAPWFHWRSKVNGTLVCAQTSLGPGWERAFGPYQDSHCTKLLGHE
jgi:hypothetical protein